MSDPRETPPGEILAPLPLLIGISGHRDLRKEDVPALESKVCGIFDEVRARYPYTPLALLSSLAEGADRLAARVALDAGVRLIAPLPMPRELYVSDFATPASRTEFEECLQRADPWFELPLVAGNTLEAIRASGEARDRQYTQGGAYIADRSEILIALWDGLVTASQGGTAQVVQFKLEGIPSPYAPPHTQSSPLDPPETGPVYQIVTPRESNPSPEGEPLALRKLFSPHERRGEAQKTYDRTYEWMETFNRDALKFARTHAKARKVSVARLLPGIDRDALPSILREIMSCYAVADTLAQHFRDRIQPAQVAQMVLIG